MWNGWNSEIMWNTRNSEIIWNSMTSEMMWNILYNVFLEGAAQQQDDSSQVQCGKYKKSYIF